jgi:hypothetical protein
MAKMANRTGPDTKERSSAPSKGEELMPEELDRVSGGKVTLSPFTFVKKTDKTSP